MSNTNTNLQTQTFNALNNAIMEAGGKDHPPMLAPGIDNDIYPAVDACPNACEIWKAIERLKQVLTSITTRMAKNKVNELRAERLARTANPLSLVAQQQPVYHPQNHPTHYTNNSSTRSQQAATRTRGKEKEIDKLMALFLYHSRKSTNLPTTTSELHQTPVEQIKTILQELTKALAKECQKPKRAKDTTYHKEKMLLCKQEEAGFHIKYEDFNSQQQIFWSIDDNNRKKAETLAPKPISALIVYPPNTPVDKQCAEIEKKNLLIENENLIVNCLSTQLLYDVEKSRCLDLEADMSKKAPDFNSFLKIKNLEHQIQEKDNMIGHLKDIVTNVKDRSREPHSAVDVTALIEQNNCDRLELEAQKSHTTVL
ncbi:hypothetical protein Tco_0504986 [Tanacetum coccineum]